MVFTTAKLCILLCILYLALVPKRLYCLAHSYMISTRKHSCKRINMHYGNGVGEITAAVKY